MVKSAPRLPFVARDRRTAVHTLIVLGILALALALNFSRIVRAEYDHDEDQFIASARLLADHALLPYRDFPYFHTPYLTLAYALVLPLAGHYNLFAARVISLVCGLATILILMLVTGDLFKDHTSTVRLWAVGAVALLLLPNPLFADAGRRGWNHNFPVLFTLLAFVGCYYSGRWKNTLLWLFASGLCLGVAVGARLSFLTAFPAFLVALLFFDSSWRSKVRALGSFVAGVLIALIPLSAFFVASPDGFLFGNLGYPRLNTLFRFDVPPISAPMELGDKLGYLWTSVIGQPANLLLFLSFLLGLSVLCYGLWRRVAPPFETVLILLAVPCVGIGSFLPTPSWYQYFYAPVVFALIVVAFGLAHLTRPGTGQAKWAIVMFTEIVVLANLYGLDDYRRMSFVLHPDAWRPLMFHDIGGEVRAAFGDTPNAANPRVLTLGPLFPLEAGLDIYPAFATGPFAWRTSRYLDSATREALGVVSAEDLARYLSGSPPDGILVGFNPNLESRFVEYAAQHGYQPVPIEGSDLQLWIRPAHEAP